MTQATQSPPASSFLGLAPFLRMSIAGENLQAVGQQLLGFVQQFPEDKNLWMNLSTVMFCLEQPEPATNIQAEALAMGRTYVLPAMQQPARCRLLLLMAPGDLAANTPLDCLLEDSDVDLIYQYLLPGEALPENLPEHDALMVGLSEIDENRLTLQYLETALANWPRPVINPPQCIPAVGRELASQLLRDAPGSCIPPTFRISRSQLVRVVIGQTPLNELLPGHDFPLIVRPVDSHAGRDLARVANLTELADYLARVDEAEFFLSDFIDYSGPDGLFRKFRVALVDGQPFACHMAVSAHWMVHYVNASMYEDADRRAEEARFMENFPAFAQRHQQAFAEIHQRTGLDYVCIDCAETHDGRLLIFEIDHAMVVHAMDSLELFPYKQTHMLKVKAAFRDFLSRLGAGRAA